MRYEVFKNIVNASATDSTLTRAGSMSSGQFGLQSKNF